MQNAERRTKNVEGTFFSILHSAFCVLHSSLIEPSSLKSCSTKATNDMRILLHGFPHQAAAVVLDHGDDRSLIDAQVVDVEPAVLVARVEGVCESVLTIQVRTVAPLHFLHCRD